MRCLRGAQILCVALYCFLNVDQTYGLDYGKGTCIVVRGKRDTLYAPVKNTRCTSQIKSVCETYGAVQEDATKCACTCPALKPTLVDKTKKCSDYKNVWPAGCKFQARGFGVLAVYLYTDMKVLIPGKYRRCGRFTVDPQNSYYLDHKGWKKIPLNLGFPFKIEIRSGSPRRRRRKNFKVHMIKWSKPPNKTLSSYKLNGKIIRLGLRCRKIQQCILFKVAGQRMQECTIPKPTPIVPGNHPAGPSTNITPTVLPSSSKPLPSIADKGKRDGASDESGSTPWAVTGAVIGIAAVVLICIVVLLFICRRRKSRFNKRQNHKASSSCDVNSVSESASEVPAYRPFHSYQELKPPVIGAPPGAYHPLTCKAKEDPSGYLLPSPAILGTSTSEEPIYNEIGSPQARPQFVYDYAVPENTVRFSADLTDNKNTHKDPDYEGRPSATQEEQNPQDDNDTDSTEIRVSRQNDEQDCNMESGYLDFNAEGSSNKLPEFKDEPSPSDSTKSPYIAFIDEKGTGQSELGVKSEVKEKSSPPGSTKEYQI